MAMVRLFSTLVICGVVISGCSSSASSDSKNSPDPASHVALDLYPASGGPLAPKIRRTAGGVPHISADNLAAVTAGLGYAQAEDNICVLADGFLKVRGERAEFFGFGPDDAYAISDFSYKALRLLDGAQDAVDSLSNNMKAMVDGYVAGYNHYVTTSDANTWPAACRAAAWVRPIDAADLLAYYRWLAQLASGEFFASGAILAAVPPNVSPLPDVVSLNNEAMRWKNQERLTASNAWAIGGELTENGRGALLANPHFPYSGALRFYQSQLTIPGQLNVHGAGLLGTAIPLIGFNDNVAWTHTNSTSIRFTAYQLTLDPNNPMQYIKDGEAKPITARKIQVRVATGSGAPIVLERDVYDSEYGPMLSMAAVTDGALPAWADGETAYTYRDANANTTVLDTWLGFATASDLTSFQQVIEQCGSTLWTNAIYADKTGTAFYMDSSSVPYLSADTLAQLTNSLSDPLTNDLYNNGLVILDGSTSRDDWLKGPCEGRLPYADMPKLERNDFVQNSNDSYWSTNPAALLTGYSPLNGSEATPLNPRTRLGLTMLQNPTDPGFDDSTPAGADGLFNAQELLRVIWNNRTFFSEALLPGVRERCELIGDIPVTSIDGPEESVAEACTVLSNWRGTYDTDAVGAHLFRLLLAEMFQLPELDPIIDFDPTDPVNTPAMLPPQNKGTPDDLVLQSLVQATRTLNALGIPLDATLGSVQTYRPTGGTQPGGAPTELATALPWHGGSGSLDGAFNAIEPVDANVQQNTVIPRLNSPKLINTGGLSALPGEGWKIGRGTSWHFGLQFNDDGPEAYGFVSYGQSTNPTQPWYTTQTEAYSARIPLPIAFTEADIAAATLMGGETTLAITR
jgi:acyl-homoserine-lactone acylase